MQHWVFIIDSGHYAFWKKEEQNVRIEISDSTETFQQKFFNSLDNIYLLFNLNKI